MKVLLIGKTEVDLFPPQGNSRHVMPGKADNSEFQRRVAADTLSRGDHGQTGQELIEFAGRLCYESFDLPNENTKTNSRYVRSLIDKQHESVLEHVSVSFYVEGVSRSFTHELIRHRHLSFSELSQRYVDMHKANYIVPPLYHPNLGETVSLKDTDLAYVEMYQHNVNWAESKGVGKKQAREAARSVLPNAIETKLVVSGNLRAWRDVLKKRWSKHADAEMQDFAGEVLNVLYLEYPDVFGDITYG